MDFIEFIFLLLTKHVPMPESKLKRLKLDGNTWYEKLGTSDDCHPLLKQFKFFSEQWYVQVLLGILFLWVDKSVNEFVNAPPAPDDDDDDDDDEDDEDDRK